jgi:hypothetical protein
MGILKSRQFWVGAAVGVIGFYLYQNHLKGMGKGGGS